MDEARSISRQAQIDQSLADFDAMLKIEPKAYPSLWMRGIALYYAGKYEEGAKQFAACNKESPSDVEDAFWNWMCNAKAQSPAKATAQVLPVANDSRIPMMALHSLISGKSKPQDIVAAA